MSMCRLPFGLRLEHLAVNNPKKVEYEPELFSGAIIRFEVIF